MSDERRASDRRDEDVRLAEAVEHFWSLLDERLAQEWKKADAIHEDIKSQLEDHRHKHLESNQEKIITLLTGDKGNALAGRAASPGLLSNVNTLTSDVEWIKGEISGSGVKVRLPMGAWAAIWVAIIAGLFQVLSALVGSL